MTKGRVSEQKDLFAVDAGEIGPASPSEPIPADFVERIRQELRTTLASVQAAQALPWPDLTNSYVAELRFESIA
ncbi:MAG: hypothetical protein ACREFZ_06060, partial [Acetobacteraceae bacterium]